MVGEIDGRPATEFLAPYLDPRGRAGRAGNPLAVAEVGTDGSYLRAIIGSDPTTGSVSLFGSVPVGASVQPTTADTDHILAGTRDALRGRRGTFQPVRTPGSAHLFVRGAQVPPGLPDPRGGRAARAALGAFPFAGSTVPAS